MLFILKLCYLLRDDLNKKYITDAPTGTEGSIKYFMDSPTVTAAINNNKPAELTEQTNIFIQQSLSHIEGVGPRFENIKNSKIEPSLTNSIFMIDVASNCHTFPLKNKIKDWYAKRLIIIQLAIWSSVSSDCFNLISTILLTFWSQKIDVKQMDENELWHWLHCLTRCILSTTRFVYEIYATDLYSKNPLCQLLLLQASIHHNANPFMKFGINPSGHDLGIDTSIVFQKNMWKYTTNEFVSYLNKSTVLWKSWSDENKTLKFFGEWGKPVITMTKVLVTMDCFITESVNVLVEKEQHPILLKVLDKSDNELKKKNILSHRNSLNFHQKKCQQMKQLQHN